MQPPSVTQLLSTILDILGYSGDKNAFLQNFFQQIFQKVMQQLALSLPKGRQEEFKEKVRSCTSIRQMELICYTYISKEQYTHTLEQISRQEFMQFLENAIIHIPQTKKDQLKSYIFSLVATFKIPLVFPSQRRSV